MYNNYHRGRGGAPPQQKRQQTANSNADAYYSHTSARNTQGGYQLRGGASYGASRAFIDNRTGNQYKTSNNYGAYQQQQYQVSTRGDNNKYDYYGEEEEEIMYYQEEDSYSRKGGKSTDGSGYHKEYQHVAPGASQDEHNSRVVVVGASQAAEAKRGEDEQEDDNYYGQEQQNWDQKRDGYSNEVSNQHHQTSQRQYRGDKQQPISGQHSSGYREQQYIAQYPGDPIPRSSGNNTPYQSSYRQASATTSDIKYQKDDRDYIGNQPYRQYQTTRGGIKSQSKYAIRTVITSAYSEDVQYNKNYTHKDGQYSEGYGKEQDYYQDGYEKAQKYYNNEESEYQKKVDGSIRGTYNVVSRPPHSANSGYPQSNVGQDSANGTVYRYQPKIKLSSKDNEDATGDSTNGYHEKDQTTHGDYGEESGSPHQRMPTQTHRKVFIQKDQPLAADLTPGGGEQLRSRQSSDWESVGDQEDPSTSQINEVIDDHKHNSQPSSQPTHHDRQQSEYRKVARSNISFEDHIARAEKELGSSQKPGAAVYQKSQLEQYGHQKQNNAPSLAQQSYALKSNSVQPPRNKSIDDDQLILQEALIFIVPEPEYKELGLSNSSSNQTTPTVPVLSSQNSISSGRVQNLNQQMKQLQLEGQSSVGSNRAIRVVNNFPQQMGQQQQINPNAKVHHQDQIWADQWQQQQANLQRQVHNIGHQEQPYTQENIHTGDNAQYRIHQSLSSSQTPTQVLQFDRQAPQHYLQHQNSYQPQQLTPLQQDEQSYFIQQNQNYQPSSHQQQDIHHYFQNYQQPEAQINTFDVNVDQYSTALSKQNSYQGFSNNTQSQLSSMNLNSRTFYPQAPITPQNSFNNMGMSPSKQQITSGEIQITYPTYNRGMENPPIAAKSPSVALNFNAQEFIPAYKRTQNQYEALQKQQQLLQQQFLEYPQGGLYTHSLTPQTLNYDNIQQEDAQQHHYGDQTFAYQQQQMQFSAYDQKQPIEGYRYSQQQQQPYPTQQTGRMSTEPGVINQQQFDQQQQQYAAYQQQQQYMQRQQYQNEEQMMYKQQYRQMEDQDNSNPEGTGDTLDDETNDIDDIMLIKYHNQLNYGQEDAIAENVGEQKQNSPTKIV